LEEFWRNLDESGGICERKTLFWIKKEADQAGFKGTRTGPCVVVFALSTYNAILANVVL